jgi:hypothetical protein
MVLPDHRVLLVRKVPLALQVLPAPQVLLT